MPDGPKGHLPLPDIKETPMIEATLDVLVSTTGKDRGGPGMSVPLRMTEEEWQQLIDLSLTCSEITLVQQALRHRASSQTD